MNAMAAEIQRLTNAITPPTPPVGPPSPAPVPPSLWPTPEPWVGTRNAEGCNPFLMNFSILFALQPHTPPKWPRWRLPSITWWLYDDCGFLKGCQSVPRKYPPHHYTTTISLNRWYKAGWIHAFMLFTLILTLPSACCSRNRDSSDQATFFQSSIVQFWWACANCSLSFLFLADRSGTRCGLLLL